MSRSARSAKRARALALLVLVAAIAVVSGASGQAARGRCLAHGRLPDRRCTPGGVFLAAGTGEICRAGYARSVRNVPYALKRRIYAAYGIRHHAYGTYEIDHLIPLELGGSNAAVNLWPQVAPDFRVKDRLENALHQSVCSGQLRLRAAQHEIAHDWHAAWVGAGSP